MPRRLYTSRSLIRIPWLCEDVHSVVGVTDLGSLLANDFDPDGDPINQIVYFVKPAIRFPRTAIFKLYGSVLVQKITIR